MNFNQTTTMQLPIGIKMEDGDNQEVILRMKQSLLDGKSINEHHHQNDVILLIQNATYVFNSQPVFLKLDAPLRICGDVHGQFVDLMRLLNHGKFPPNTKWLFLGDYVDRGPRQLDTICLLLIYKVLYPDHIYLLRGNHECLDTCVNYGFKDELELNWGKYVGSHLLQQFGTMFTFMPPTAIVNDKILCMHGGLSPHLNRLEQLNQIPRPIEPESSPLLMDLLWSDPDNKKEGWWPNRRGVSLVFGADVAEQFCRKFNIDLIIRAHQVADYGFEFPFTNRRVLTIFSAPLYTNRFRNSAATVNVDANLRCSFHVFRPNNQ